MKSDQNARVRNYTLISEKEFPKQRWPVYQNCLGFDEKDAIKKHLIETFKEPYEVKQIDSRYEANVHINQDWARTLTYTYYVLEGNWKVRKDKRKGFFYLLNFFKILKMSKEEAFLFVNFIRED